jgi:serine/threonine protein phosphatase PrpC
MARHISWRKLASGRQSSEDRAEVFERGDELVVIVADGAGGISGGARAAGAIVETVQSVAHNPSLDLHDADMWKALLREADATLATRAAGETTATIVVVGPSGLTGVSVGDSEAWIVAGTSMDDLTRSQERPRLGTGRAVPVAFRRRAVDGVLLVATDGLFKHASVGRIAATVREGEVSRAAERLAALVQLASGGYPDDLGIVVVAAG